MGCKAFTPHMVSLANELEDAPFHLLASYNQRGNPEKIKHEIFQNGLSPLTPNVTVSYQAGHPGVKGTGYVPYYLVFDQHGDLAYHHQGGPYHGGDGTAVLDRVRGMIQEIPAVYIGKEPFQKFESLARKIESGKKLGKHLKALATEWSTQSEDPELQRLVQGIERYRDRMLQKIDHLHPLDPKSAAKLLSEQAKLFTGTPWVGNLESLANDSAAPKARKLHKEAAKELASILTKIGKLKTTRGNGGPVINPLDPGFREANAKDLGGIVADLTKLQQTYSGLPAAKRAAQWLALFE